MKMIFIFCITILREREDINDVHKALCWIDLFPIPFPDKYFIYLSQECYFFKKHGHSKCSVGMGKVDSRILGPNMTTSCPSKQENIMQSFSWKISCRGTLSAWDIHWHLCHLGTT